MKSLNNSAQHICTYVYNTDGKFSVDIQSMYDLSLKDGTSMAQTNGTPLYTLKFAFIQNIMRFPNYVSV